MISRALIMLGLSVKAFFHRLRHDFAREIVVGFSSLIILATFFYVFNDFLNVEVASLSLGMRASFAKVATAVTMVGVAVFAGKLMAQARYGERTISSFARVAGEENGVIVIFYSLHGALVIVLCHGIGWWITQRWLFALPTGPGVATGLLMLGVTTAFALRRPIGPQHDPSSTQTKRELFTWGQLPTKSALVSWRLGQIVFRHRLSRLCLGFGALLLIPVLWSGLIGTPPFVGVTSGLGAGFVASLALIFFVMDDIGQAWTERGAGVSHGQFVSAYEVLSWRIGCGYAVVGAGLFLLANYLRLSEIVNIGPKGNTGGGVLGDAGKVFCVTLLPFLTAPWLMFQIDARRPWITAVVTLLVNLFVGTAIIASWLSIILIPILRYYGLQSQNGRFYRA